LNGQNFSPDTVREMLTICVLSYGSLRINSRKKDVRKIYQENGLPVLEKGKRTGGSDGADVTAFGIPCIDSLGAEGDGIHSIDEFAWLSSLAESAKRIASVVYCI